MLAPGSSGVFAPDLTSPLFLFMLIAVPKSHDYSKQGQEVGEGWQPNIQRVEEGQLRDPDRQRTRAELLLLLIGVGVGIWVFGEVKGQDFADHTVPLLGVDSNETLSLGVELLLERDDDGLEVAG